MRGEGLRFMDTKSTRACLRASIAKRDTMPLFPTRLAIATFAGLLSACATRELPRHAQSSPASPSAATPEAPAVATALRDDPAPGAPGTADAGEAGTSEPQHHHGAQHAH
jgi:hypothetical protein